MNPQNVINCIAKKMPYWFFSSIQPICHPVSQKMIFTHRLCIICALRYTLIKDRRSRFCQWILFPVGQLQKKKKKGSPLLRDMKQSVTGTSSDEQRWWHEENICFYKKSSPFALRSKNQRHYKSPTNNFDTILSNSYLYTQWNDLWDRGMGCVVYFDRAREEKSRSGGGDVILAMLW